MKNDTVICGLAFFINEKGEFGIDYVKINNLDRLKELEFSDTQRDVIVHIHGFVEDIYRTITKNYETVEFVDE